MNLSARAGAEAPSIPYPPRRTWRNHEYAGLAAVAAGLRIIVADRRSLHPVGGFDRILGAVLPGLEPLACLRPVRRPGAQVPAGRLSVAAAGHGPGDPPLAADAAGQAGLPGAA